MQEDEKLVLDVPAQWRDQVAATLCECAIGLARQGESHPGHKLREIAKGLGEVLRPLAARTGQAASSPRPAHPESEASS